MLILRYERGIILWNVEKFVTEQGYTTYGKQVISNRNNGGMITAVILYPTYEQMHIHSYKYMSTTYG